TSNTHLMLAMERGELDGISNSWTSLKAAHPDWIRDGKVKILAQIANASHADLPGVPLISDIASGPALLPAFSPTDAALTWKIMLIQKAMGRPFAVGPDVSPDRLAVLRSAFDAMLEDAAFKEDAEKSIIEITPISGRDIEEMVHSVAAAPRSLLT